MMARAASIVPIFFRIRLLMVRTGENILRYYNKFLEVNEGKMRRKENPLMFNQGEGFEDKRK